MPEYNGKCAIWPEFDAYSSYAYSQANGKNGDFDQLYIESPRVGGRYYIDIDAMDTLLRLNSSDLRKKVSWWLANQWRQHVEIPLVTRDVLAYLQAQPMLHPGERAEWLLWYLAEHTKQIGQTLSFWPAYDTPFYYGALVVTQSESIEEINKLINHLVQKRALEYVGSDAVFSVTVDGFEELRPRTQATAYDQVFVAMWFHTSTEELYDKGIEPAIRDAGYKPYIVSRDPSVNKIDDAIIANIRQSKFVVADFTHGDSGHRGSVYYEAGFAEGLGLQVIRTCRSDLIDANSLAFDTRQHNHIGWDKDNTDYPAFTKELTNRIIARVGRGPIQGNALRG